MLSTMPKTCGKPWSADCCLISDISDSKIVEDSISGCNNTQGLNERAIIILSTFLFTYFYFFTSSTKKWCLTLDYLSDHCILTMIIYHYSVFMSKSFVIIIKKEL